MSNGNDIKVDSIDEDINELKTLLFQDRLTNYGKRKMINYYENEITRQKQINEEHQKINGELREQVRMLEEDIKEIKESIEEAYRCYEYDLDYSPFSKGIAEMIENILAEREQKDKRIKELEEQVETKQKFIIMASEVIENSIPEQAVIDKINEYDKKMEEDAGHPHWVVTDRIVMNVLQELLEGGK